MNILETLKNFDVYLEEEGCHFEAVIIGGAALNLLSITSRVTRDIDVMDPNEIPGDIKKLSRDFALKNQLPSDWLNSGPADVLKYLPKGWEQRTVDVFKGQNINLKTLASKELLMTKCWAYCDRERDFEDILLMSPSKEDLLEVSEWLKPLDGNPQWPQFVEERIAFILEELSKA